MKNQENEKSEQEEEKRGKCEKLIDQFVCKFFLLFHMRKDL